MPFRCSQWMLLLLPCAGTAAGVCRRVAIVGGILGAAPRRASAAPAERLFPMYCIPGVTAERCRGVFWETGKLYRKEEQGAMLSAEEYAEGRETLLGLRAALEKERDGDRLGEAASSARAALRQIGGRLCRALSEDERYELEFRLNEVMSALDDVDIAALREAGQPQRAAPGFGESDLLLRKALGRLDDFLKALPTSMPT